MIKLSKSRLSIEETENAEFRVEVIAKKGAKGYNVLLQCEKIAEIGIFVDGEKRITIGHTYVPRVTWRRVTELCNNGAKQAFENGTRTFDETYYLSDTNPDFKWIIERLITSELSSHKDWEEQSVKDILDIIYGAIHQSKNKNIRAEYNNIVKNEREECEILGFTADVLPPDLLGNGVQTFKVLKSKV